MGRAWGWVAVVSMASALVACPFKKKGPSDGGEDAVAAASASAEPPAASAQQQAANESQVTRYPDERPFDHATVTTESSANVRTQAGSGGDLIIVLKKGTQVDKTAEHGESYLVIAEDPKDPSRKLMGWVVESAFGPEPVVVRRHEHDGGAGTPVDAGGGADAGKTPTVDAGTQPSTSVCVKQKPPGSCPAGYVVSQAVCRVPCKAATDCKGPEPKCNAGLCYASNGCP